MLAYNTSFLPTISHVIITYFYLLHYWIIITYYFNCKYYILFR